MAIIKKVKGFMPKFGSGCFFADNATLAGDIVMGDNCSVWFNAVVRGDVNSIRIGNKVNIQDGAIIHGTYQRYAACIGNNVSVGHRAIVHGCTVEDNVLIGMGAILMDGVVVEKNSLIAAGAIVLEKTVIESGTVYAGAPAQMVKKISKKQFQEMIERIADNYVMYARWYD